MILAQMAFILGVLTIATGCGGSFDSAHPDASRVHGSVTEFVVPVQIGESSTPDDSHEESLAETRLAGDLESVTLVQTVEPTDLLQQMAIDFGSALSTITDQMSAVSVYKIEYWTPNLEGELVLASGALFLPENLSSQNIVVYSHGTVAPGPNAEIPSSFRGSESEGVAVISSLGFAVVAADYIGYGSSGEERHSYLNASLQSQTGVNHLKAALQSKQVKELSTPVDPLQVVSMGYSQGGGVGVAVHRALDNENGFAVTHGIYGAGPYDLAEALNQGWSRSFFRDNRLVSWVIGSLSLDFDLGLSNEDIFKDPYAAEVDREVTFYPAMSQNPGDVFVNDFMQGLLSNLNDPTRVALDMQSVYKTWQPKGEVYLYHGVSDLTVPVASSSVAFDELASRDIDVLYVTDDGDHFSGIDSFLFLTVNVLRGSSLARDALSELASHQTRMDLHKDVISDFDEILAEGIGLKLPPIPSLPSLSDFY